MNSTTSVRKLYRTRDNRVIAGVCGGIGQYLGVDPTVVRLATILLALLSGIGLVLYIAAWLLVPEETLN